MSGIRRRDLFLGVTAAAGAVAAASATSGSSRDASPELTARRDKRRPQYQPNSAEVQTFYRVNGYPRNESET
jgi:hypothetical protein